MEKQRGSMGLDVMSQLKAIGASLTRRGLAFGSYFSDIDLDEDTTTARDVRDHFSERLRSADDTPQMVTVRGRGGESNRAYLILRVEKMAEVLQAVENEVPPAETITDRMRRIRGDMALPSVRLAPQRSRSAVPRLSASSVES